MSPCQGPGRWPPTKQLPVAAGRPATIPEWECGDAFESVSTLELQSRGGWAADSPGIGSITPGKGLKTQHFNTLRDDRRPFLDLQLPDWNAIAPNPVEAVLGSITKRVLLVGPIEGGGAESVELLPAEVVVVSVLRQRPA